MTTDTVTRRGPARPAAYPGSRRTGTVGAMGNPSGKRGEASPVRSPADLAPPRRKAMGLRHRPAQASLPRHSPVLPFANYLIVVGDLLLPWWRWTAA